MNRRRVLAGIGAAVAGGSVVGAGAYSQVSGERDADIAVTREDEAYLQLETLDSVDYPNAPIAQSTGSGATLELDFNQVLEGKGYGPNPDAYLTFDDIFRVTNTGSQDVYFWAEFPDAPVYDEMGFYADDPSDLADGETGAIPLPLGEEVLVGAAIDTDQVVNDDSEELVTVTIHATESDPTADGGD